MKVEPIPQEFQEEHNRLATILAQRQASVTACGEALAEATTQRNNARAEIDNLFNRLIYTLKLDRNYWVVDDSWKYLVKT